MEYATASIGLVPRAHLQDDLTPRHHVAPCTTSPSRTSPRPPPRRQPQQQQQQQQASRWVVARTQTTRLLLASPAPGLGQSTARLGLIQTGRISGIDIVAHDHGGFLR
jgi:hypothetical protein